VLWERDRAILTVRLHQGSLRPASLGTGTYDRGTSLVVQKTHNSLNTRM
jgi:hypothetical protein